MIQYRNGILSISNYLVVLVVMVLLGFLFEKISHKPNKYSVGDCYIQDVEAWEDHTVCRIKVVGKKKYKVACPLAPGLFVEDEVETTETFQTIEENTIKVPCGVTQ